MSTRLLILTNMILHMVTFIALALGSIYELGWLTFGSLVTLMLGLYFGREALDRLDYDDPDPDDEDSPLYRSHRADIVNKRD